MTQRIRGRFPPGNGVGKGDGWGGPAKGAGKPKLKPAGDPESDAVRAMKHDPTVIRGKAERLEAVKDKIFELAMTAERQETQLSAAIAYANREEGMPIARTVTASVVDPSQLTDAELAAIAAGGRAPAAAPPPSEDEPGGVVH